MREIRSLTGLRGVAAIYVMIYHFAGGAAAAHPSTISTFITHGYIAVDLFFVMSGFVMALTYRGLFGEGRVLAAHRTFLARRVARIYPLYLVGTLVALALNALPIDDGVPLSTLPLLVLFNLPMVQTWFDVPSLDFPAWSISTEWAAYLVFPLLLPPLMRSGRAGFLAAVAAASLVVVLLGLLPGWTLLHPERHGGINVMRGGIWPVARCLAEFALGMAAFRVAQSPPGRRVAARGAVSTLVGALALATLFSPALDLLAIALFPLLVVALSADRGPLAAMLASRPVHALGLWSYAIYLLHPLVADIVDLSRPALRAIGMILIDPGTDAATCVITIALASLAYRFIETPGRRGLQHVLSRPASPPSGRAARAAGAGQRS